MYGLELSVGVLAFCAQQDPYAGHFLATVSVFKDMIQIRSLSESTQRHNPLSGSTNSESKMASIDYLLESNSSSEVASSGALGNVALTPSTVSSTLDLLAY